MTRSEREFRAVGVFRRYRGKGFRVPVKRKL